MSLQDSYLEAEDFEAKALAQKQSKTWSMTAHHFKRLMSYVLKHPRIFSFGIFLVLLGTFATLLEPRLFGYAIDDAIVPRRWTRLTQLSGFFLIVVCVRIGSMIGQGYLFEYLGQRVTQDLRMRLFAHLQRMPVSVYDKNPAGRLMTRITNDIAALGEMFSMGFVLVISNFLLVVGILVWLLILDVKLGLLASSVFPILIVASAFFSKKLQIAYRESRTRLSALNSFLAENLLGIKVVNLFNRQRVHLERFERLNQWYADAQISSVKVFAFFQPTITWCSGVSLALVIWYGGKETWHGALQIGVLVAYFSYALSLFQPVREIADKWNVFVSAMTSAERIFAILDWQEEVGIVFAGADTEKPAKRIERLKGHIVFENVWFAYTDENWVLRDFLLEIKPGSRVGVVGHTGAGKTTLISLLMRYYDPQKGRILLDGKDLREYEKRSLRAAIGLVQQDVFLFSGNIRDNIDFWSGGADVFSKLADLGVAGQWDEAKMNSELQERGSNMSLGERQVIAFARALAADPSLWILDEATANMDSETEQHMETALSRATRDRTTFLIAHRLATVRNADTILVLHKGSLLEQGKHSDLVGKNGLYARLYRYQRAVDQSQNV